MEELRETLSANTEEKSAFIDLEITTVPARVLSWKYAGGYRCS